MSNSSTVNDKILPPDLVALVHMQTYIVYSYYLRKVVSETLQERKDIKNTIFSFSYSSHKIVLANRSCIISVFFVLDRSCIPILTGS